MTPTTARFIVVSISVLLGAFGLLIVYLVATGVAAKLSS